VAATRPRPAQAVPMQSSGAESRGGLPRLSQLVRVWSRFGRESLEGSPEEPEDEPSLAEECQRARREVEVGYQDAANASARCAEPATISRRPRSFGKGAVLRSRTARAMRWIPKNARLRAQPASNEAMDASTCVCSCSDVTGEPLWEPPLCQRTESATSQHRLRREGLTRCCLQPHQPGLAEQQVVGQHCPRAWLSPAGSTDATRVAAAERALSGEGSSNRLP